MRILFAFAGGAGHFGPLAPIARATRAAGHTVAVTGRRTILDVVSGAGFTVLPGSDDGYAGRMLQQTLDEAVAEQRFWESFAGWLGRSRIPGLFARCAEWRPDLIVCDECDFAAMLVAEALGLPYATVQVFASGCFMRGDGLVERLGKLRADLGLPPDPDLTMLSRYLVLSPLPPSLRDPRYRQLPNAHAIRPGDADLPTVDGHPWQPSRPDAPTVYVTLGTAFNVQSSDVFSRVLAALRDLPVNAVVTVGRQLDPASFGRQPAHIHVASYLPLAAILPHCDAIVSHGGTGTVVAGLARGLPQVTIPIGADQPANARRCRELGIGPSLNPLEAGPDAIAAAVQRVLSDPVHRRAAQRVHDEITTLPDAEQAVRMLERLAARG